MTAPDNSRRIFHITASLSRRGGGIPPVVWSLAQHTRELGRESVVSGLKDGNFEMDCRNPSAAVVTGTVRGPQAMGYSPELRRALSRLIRPTDVVHAHGLWMYPGTLAFQLSRQRKCRRLVSPHGMLEPWALKHSRWKKLVAGWLFETRNLRTADCLHALCAREAESFRQRGLRNPIAIIPNGVDADALQPRRNKQDFVRDHPHLEGRRLLLFLSRIHPKKGLANLLHAWANAKAAEANWSLLVVGPDERNHEASLRKLAADLGIDRHVHFPGPAYGQMKRQVLSAADAFILPSLSEGFSMVVLEAAAAALPVVLTRECNFPELAAAGAAIEIPAGVEGVTLGLKRLLQLDERERTQMGARGIELVKRSYAWPAIASTMMQVYDWMAGAGPRPECVQAG